MDLKNNPLDADLQSQAGKCLNKKECRLCAQRVLQYVEQRKEEFDKEEAVKLKKKQTNEKAKLKKREKQVEKEREEKRQNRLEQAQKRQSEREKQQQTKHSEEEEDDQKKVKVDQSNKEQSEGWGKIIGDRADHAFHLTLFSSIGGYRWYFKWCLTQSHGFFHMANVSQSSATFEFSRFLQIYLTKSMKSLLILLFSLIRYLLRYPALPGKYSTQS